MYIRCAKCQHKLPQEEDGPGLLLGMAGASVVVGAASYMLQLLRPELPLGCGVLALCATGLAYKRSCQIFALNAAGPGSWGVECPHCQHVNFWKG
jgi:phage FluMu protein Com